MSPRREIWLVRHGPTEWSENGRHTGTTDVPLVPVGIRRAADLQPVLTHHEFALVLTSPLQRARETARLAGFAERAEVTDDLREWDYGDYEGLTSAEIREGDPGWTIWSGAVPGGETARQVATRARRVIERCDAATDGDAILFAHGHVLRVLTAVALGFGAVDGARFALDTATINILGWEHEYRTLRRWNTAKPQPPLVRRER